MKHRKISFKAQMNNTKLDEFGGDKMSMESEEFDQQIEKKNKEARERLKEYEE